MDFLINRLDVEVSGISVNYGGLGWKINVVKITTFNGDLRVGFEFTAGAASENRVNLKAKSGSSLLGGEFKNDTITGAKVDEIIFFA